MPSVGRFMNRVEMDPNGSFYLPPNTCLLGTTVEKFCIPVHLRGSVEGKSSLARLFVVPHVAAGYIDPGFCGHITLEIVNLGPFTIILRPGDRIAQISLANCTQCAERPYGHKDLGSHYQNQADVQGSKYGEGVKE